VSVLYDKEKLNFLWVREGSWRRKTVEAGYCRDRSIANSPRGKGAEKKSIPKRGFIKKSGKGSV